MNARRQPEAGRRGAQRATSRQGGSQRGGSQHGGGGRAWLRHHREIMTDSARRLIRRPVSSLLTMLAIAIALILPAGLWLVLDSARLLDDRLDDSATLTVYFDADVDETRAMGLATNIGDQAGVAATRLVTAAEGLADFQQSLGVDDALSELDQNPLPASVVVTPDDTTPAAVQTLSQSLKQLPGVDEVRLDLAWLDRLQQLAALGQRVTLGLALLFGLGVLLVVGNTVRLAVESRRQEIEVVTLIGATYAFVRRPFLYSGAWYGLGGGALALVILALGGNWLAAPVAALAQSYGAEFTLPSLGLTHSAFLLFFSTILGWLGAWIAVGRHLADIKPR
ncbi:permease-like cell division protein FtsX [Salinicola rhizosphaerae]|uniref:Cell division protein FtsX n=1 Tax=Salinicola rhizosphaerae TaxID=1443141 RepID=A0ABQ3E0I2_9GAMM|nr:permease-like cell division protein FtsX [Salinicola rhizosphaerae]GHB19668.1 cell division protein FtsX [Salinicola rhizosphaerae]